MCVCMYVSSMYGCMLYIYVCEYVCIYVCVYAIYVCVYLCMYLVCMYVSIYLSIEPQTLCLNLLSSVRHCPCPFRRIADYYSAICNPSECIICR